MQTSDYLAKDLLNTETATTVPARSGPAPAVAADRPLPVLHVFWKDAAGRQLRSDWTPRCRAGWPGSFIGELGRRDAALAGTVSRSALSLAWARRAVRLQSFPLLEISAGNALLPQNRAAGTRRTRPTGRPVSHGRTDPYAAEGPT